MFNCLSLKKIFWPNVFMQILSCFSVALQRKCPQLYPSLFSLEPTLIRMCFKEFTKLFPDIMTNKLHIANSIDLFFSFYFLIPV